MANYLPGSTVAITRNEYARVLGDTAVTITNGGSADVDASIGHEAAGNDDPNHVYAVSGNSVDLKIDYGAGNTARWRGVALINHNLASDATIRIMGNATDAWGSPSVDSGDKNPTQYVAETINRSWQHSFADGDTGDYRYWRIQITNTAAAPDPVVTFIGELWIGVKTFDRTVADEDADADQRYLSDGWLKFGSGPSGWGIGIDDAVSRHRSDYGAAWDYRRGESALTIDIDGSRLSDASWPALQMFLRRPGNRPFVFIPDTSLPFAFFVRVSSDSFARLDMSQNFTMPEMKLIQDAMVRPPNLARWAGV